MRIKSYSDLWQRTKVLPKWPMDESATYQTLADLSKDLREWYFGMPDSVPGGMLLTEDAMNAYKALQAKIAEVVSGSDSTRKLTPEDYEEVRERSSAMRTELTRDLLSRRETPGDAAY